VTNRTYLECVLMLVLEHLLMLDVSLDNRAEQQKIAAAEAASSQTPQPTANLTQRTPQTLQIANIHVRAHVLVGTKETERGYASYSSNGVWYPKANLRDTLSSKQASI
jgi:hypothetical protein